MDPVFPCILIPHYFVVSLSSKMLVMLKMLFVVVTAILSMATGYGLGSVLLFIVRYI